MTKESHASGFPNKLLPRVLRAQEVGVLISRPGHPGPLSILLSTRSSAHSFIHKYLVQGPCQGRPSQASSCHTALCMCKLTRTPCTDSPSPVAASAVLCGHPANTWSAGGRPPCRYTCPHCPGQSCTPASSPRGWWATPGEGQARKGTRRERENVRMRETCTRVPRAQGIGEELCLKMHVQPWVLRVLTSNQINAEGGGRGCRCTRLGEEPYKKPVANGLGNQTPSSPSKVLMSLDFLFPNTWRQVPLL